LPNQSELHTLRVTVARIAQSLGLEDEIPGVTEDDLRHLPFERLVECAKENDRGWNALCTSIIETIEMLQR